MRPQQAREERPQHLPRTLQHRSGTRRQRNPTLALRIPLLIEIASSFEPFPHPYIPTSTFHTQFRCWDLLDEETPAQKSFFTIKREKISTQRQSHQRRNLLFRKPHFQETAYSGNLLFKKPIIQDTDFIEERKSHIHNYFLINQHVEVTTLQHQNHSKRDILLSIVPCITTQKAPESAGRSLV